MGYTIDRQRIRWLGNEGAKMSNDSKDTKPSTVAENKKIQLTEEELKKSQSMRYRMMSWTWLRAV